MATALIQKMKLDQEPAPDLIKEPSYALAVNPVNNRKDKVTRSVSFRNVC